MNLKARIPVILILGIFAMGCNLSALQPTATALPTATATDLPTATPMPSWTPTAVQTETPKPTPTHAPSATPESDTLKMPEGEPVTEWNGIPIMPGAIAGEDDGETYLFSIKAGLEEIRQYYEVELGKLGWNSFAVGEGEGQFLILMYQKGEKTLTLSMLGSPDDEGVFLVVLVK